VPIHPDLIKYVRTVVGASGLLGLAGLSAVLAAALEIPVLARIPRWALILFGLVSVAVAFVGVFVAPRWYRRASCVVATTKPLPARLTLEVESDSDTTTLYAILDCADASLSSVRFALLFPRWQVEPLYETQTDVTVFLDPESKRPVAIQTSRGMLWSKPHPRNA
jgi:hypothetical protein